MKYTDPSGFQDEDAGDGDPIPDSAADTPDCDCPGPDEISEISEDDRKQALEELNRAYAALEAEQERQQASKLWDKIDDSSWSQLDGEAAQSDSPAGHGSDAFAKLGGFLVGVTQGLLPGGVDLDRAFSSNRASDLGLAIAVGQQLGADIGVAAGVVATGLSAAGTAVSVPATVGVLSVPAAAVTTAAAVYTAAAARNGSLANENIVKAQGQSKEEAPKPKFGSKGPQITSKTIWKGGSGMRIDVENPNPGQRDGQIHFQQGYDKYLYDPVSNSFVGAPQSVNDLLGTAGVHDAIAKGLRFLGE